MQTGYFTAVFKYDDFAAMKADPVYERIFALAKVEKGEGPVRVTVLSHDDEFTRAEMFRQAVEKNKDRDDLEDEIKAIDNAESVHAYRQSREQKE